MNREPSDIEHDKLEWEQDICDELEEMQEQADEEYQKKLEKYEQDLKLWKEQKLRKVCLNMCKNIYRTCQKSTPYDLLLITRQWFKVVL